MPRLIGPSFAVLLLVAGCGPQPDREEHGDHKDAGAREIPGAAAPTAVSLTRYVGSHPSESLAGARFLDEPAVRTAIADAVPDPAVRRFIFSYDGPDAPIVLKDGRVLAWGCERHNCGYHNWSVAITPDGGSTEVCFYHDDDSVDGPATWYLPGGRTEQRPGNCPSD